jgi:alpha-mannosidase
MTIRRVFLVGHTHHDVGYTNSPRILDRMHQKIVGHVLDLYDANPETGPDAFRWTFEVSRPVLKFVHSASAKDVERLRSAVLGGRIAITGGYLNMTQLPGEAEFDAAYEQLAILRNLGLPVRTEQHGDVNGIAWGVLDGMRRAGLDRLVMALNPDHGRAPLRQPSGFWWEAQDGGRVFTWLSTHYGLGEQWGIIDADLPLAERSILNFLAELERRADYPYDTAVIHAANDNRWPTADFLEVVRQWNRRHPNIPMRTATIDEALDVLAGQAAAADIPVLRGEWSDWWSHGHGSSALEVAAYREARSLALAAQSTLGLAMLRGDGQPALSGVLGYRRGPVRLRDSREVLADLTEVDEQLLLFTEHTWGSWETYARPHSLFSRSHWNATASSAYAAYDFARDLAIEGASRLIASGSRTPDTTNSDTTTTEVITERAILVANPTETARTEPITVEIDGALERTTVATVPGFGATVIPVPQPARRRGTGDRIEAGFFRAIVDPGRGGVVSIVDERSGVELVDEDAGHGLGAILVESIAPGSTHPMLVDPKRFRPEDPGPEFRHSPATGSSDPHIEDSDHYVAISWHTSAPTVPYATATLRLYRNLPMIDLDVHLVKPASYDPESLFVAFPFAGLRPRFLLETAGAVYEADTEQLPDTAKDWYSIQHAVGVDNGATGVLWGTRDAPLVQLGGFHTGAWARHLDAPTSHINSWLMNNLHFTNFQASQDGTGSYRYRFTPTVTAVTRLAVRRYGRDLLQPLWSRQYAGPVRLNGAGGLRVEPTDRVLAEVRPEPGGVRVRVRNLGDDPIRARVLWDGELVEPADTVVPLGGFGVGDVTLHRI